MTKTRAIAPPSAARTKSPEETPHKHSICPWRSVHARTMAPCRPLAVLPGLLDERSPE